MKITKFYKHVVYYIFIYLYIIINSHLIIFLEYIDPPIAITIVDYKLKPLTFMELSRKQIITYNNVALTTEHNIIPMKSANCCGFILIYLCLLYTSRCV